jgi:hypothetical protein
MNGMRSSVARGALAEPWPDSLVPLAAVGRPFGARAAELFGCPRRADRRCVVADDPSRRQHEHANGDCGPRWHDRRRDGRHDRDERMVVRGCSRLRCSLDRDDGGDDAPGRNADGSYVRVGASPTPRADSRPDVDLHSRLHGRLGGGWHSCLCPRPVWQRIGNDALTGGAWQMGTTGARKHTGRGRALSIHTNQECLPHSLPLASCLRRTALARWTGRGTGDGTEARRLLFRMLLGAVRGDGCRGNHELGVDASADIDRFRREGAATGSARRRRDRRRADTSGDRSRRWDCSDALARLANRKMRKMGSEWILWL